MMLLGIERSRRNNDPARQRDTTGVVNALATELRATVDRLVTDKELELGRGQHRATFREALLPRTTPLSNDKWDR